jgi:two-component system, OmpR family, response regulator
MEAKMPAMTPSVKILVVDDDGEIRSLLRMILVREGFQVEEAKDAASARKRLGGGDDFDLFILDVMMPGEDGLSFCERLRETRATPILMISARSLSVDRAIGLETGADDYLPKPFERRELVARVRALLRRAAPPARSRKLRLGPLVVDRDLRAAFAADGRPLPLTAGEFALLVCFLERPGRVLSRDQLIDWTRGRDGADAFDRNIDVQMSRLRKKLGEGGFPEDGFKTVRNAGYVLTAALEPV